jgi:hypothetical protein
VRKTARSSFSGASSSAIAGVEPRRRLGPRMAEPVGRIAPGRHGVAMRGAQPGDFLGPAIERREPRLEIGAEALQIVGHDPVLARQPAEREEPLLGLLQLGGVEDQRIGRRATS